MNDDLISRKALLDDMGLDVSDEYGVTWTSDKVKEFIVRRPAVRHTNRIRSLAEAVMSKAPVWVEFKSVSDDIECDWVCEDHLNVLALLSPERLVRKHVFISQYCKSWRCWWRMPTDEERAAVPWEVE